jgi:hypothetical protein
MDPVTSSLILQGGSGLLEGMAGRKQAQGEKQRAENNAFIGRTRAMQVDTNYRTDLNSELATLRTTLATNQQRPGVGTFEVMKELRDIRSRERRIEYGNEMSNVYDARLAAKNAKASGDAAMIGGLTRAAQPAFDLYQYKRKR